MAKHTGGTSVRQPALPMEGVQETAGHPRQRSGSARARETLAIAATPAVALAAPHFATAQAVRVAEPAHALQPTPRPTRHPRASVRARFGELRAALAEGWEIVQPIFARPLWSAADDSLTAFNFVLRRECTTRLVTVPQGRTIERFIRDQKLLVDYRR